MATLPAAGARVIILTLDPYELIAETTADENGDFELYVPPGTYKLFFDNYPEGCGETAPECSHYGGVLKEDGTLDPVTASGKDFILNAGDSITGVNVELQLF